MSFHVIVLTGFLSFPLSVIFFLKLCLLSRFERAKMAGGPETMDEFLGDILEDIVENVIERIDEPKNLRYRRGVEMAARDIRKKEKADAAATATQRHDRQFASCASEIGFQVLFLSCIT